MNHLESLRQSWEEGIEPNLRELLSGPSFSEIEPLERETLVVAAICEDMRARWKQHNCERKRTSDYLTELPTDLTQLRTDSLALLFAQEWELLNESQQQELVLELSSRDAELRESLLQTIQDSERYQSLSLGQQDELRRLMLAPNDLFQTVDPKAEAGQFSKQSKVNAENEQNSDLSAAADTHATRSMLVSTQAPNKSVMQHSDAAALFSNLERFEVVRKLGSGAFGDVYLCFDQKLHRHVAIKCPRKELLEHSGDMHAFLAEARTAAALNHPGIVTTHDVIEQGDGHILIVMEYIDGGTLQSLIDQSKGRASMVQQLGTSFMASVGYQTALALAEAHHHGLIHRDLKPANLMLSGDKVRITDFGLAIAVDDLSAATGLAGTPAYMAPEQVEGRGELDPRADVWSLGVILYQLATGRLPFDGSIRETFEKIKHQTPTKPRTLDRKIPEQLESIILRCLEKNRADRFQTALEVADELRPLTIPKPPGFRWEFLVLPLGIILSIVGFGFGFNLAAMLVMLEPFFTTEDLIRYGVESYVAVALTLGFGPPLIVLGNWFCCRRCKMLGANSPNIPCKVSRWAIFSVGAAAATTGFGVPMYLLSLGLGVIAWVSIRRKSRWLTGYRHIIFGWILGAILLLPSLFFWWSFSVIYPIAAHRQQFDLALSDNDLVRAELELQELKSKSRRYPLTTKAGPELAAIYEARLALNQDDPDKALKLVNTVTEKMFLNSTARFLAQLVRAKALEKLDREFEFEAEKNAIAEFWGALPNSLPSWAKTMMKELGIEDLPRRAF